MSILSNSSNASARRKIDSKLRTMRMRITGNSVGRRGVEMASFYIFSKACYLHKDYIKLLEEIFPKPPAHSRRWCFSPFFSFPLRQQQNKLPLVIPSRCGRASSCSSFWRKEKKKKKKYKPVTFCTLLVHGNFFPACLRNDLFLLFFPPVNIITLNYLLKNGVGALQRFLMSTTVTSVPRLHSRPSE